MDCGRSISPASWFCSMLATSLEKAAGDTEHKPFDAVKA